MKLIKSLAAITMLYWSMIIHAGTNDLTKGVNLLNSTKKIYKTKSSKTKTNFSRHCIRKGINRIHKNARQTNARLQIYFSLVKIGYSKDTNIKGQVGIKNPHLNKCGNSVLVNNFLEYFRSS